MKTFAATILSMCVCAPAFADALVTKGTMTTLTVEYVFESIGKKQDRNDLHEWRVSRVAKLSAQLTAETAMAVPAMHALARESDNPLTGR